MNPVSVPRVPRVWSLGVVGLSLLLGAATRVHAQADADDASSATIDEADVSGAKLTPDEATRRLAQALPDAPDARYAATPLRRYAAMQRHYRAAQLLEDRARQIGLARQLADAGRSRAGGEVWITNDLSAEFTWGSEGKALQACEPFLADKNLSLGARAVIALRQTYFAAAGHDRAILARLWSRADDLAGQALAQGGPVPIGLALDRLQVRSEIERFQGNQATAVATLREAVGLGRRNHQAARARSGDARDPDVLDAYGRLDGSLGTKVYALLRQGRPQEAINVAQANIALWRAGQISDGLGARWNYRLATSLVSTQQYEAGLDSRDWLSLRSSAFSAPLRW